MIPMLVADLAVGERIMYPCWDENTCTDQPRTIGAIVEYPVTRVLYFREGGYGIADRYVDVDLAPCLHDQGWYRAGGDPMNPSYLCRVCDDPATPAQVEDLIADEDGAPCCPDPGCSGRPCTFPGYADNH